MIIPCNWFVYSGHNYCKKQQQGTIRLKSICQCFLMMNKHTENWSKSGPVTKITLSCLPPLLPGYFHPKVMTWPESALVSTWMPRKEVRRSDREALTQRQAFMYASAKTLFWRFNVGVCGTRIKFQMDVEICILQSAVVPGLLIHTSFFNYNSTIIDFYRLCLTKKRGGIKEKTGETKQGHLKRNEMRRCVKWQPLLTRKTAAHSWISCQSALPAGEIPNGVYLHMLSAQNVRYYDL